MRIWLTHSVLSTAVDWVPRGQADLLVGDAGLAQAAAVEAEDRLSTLALVMPAWVIAPVTVLLIVGSAVPLAQLASLFQKPQPPVLCV